ncbi:MAG TPA: phage head closure protein [Desulfitobacteriaceae bacterium]|nr:phage head closure protein [Desulfitobacteriaceae bacterium]
MRNIGELRHLITIKYNATLGMTNSDGFPVETWVTLTTAWAKRSGLKGRLFYQAAAAQAETDVIFTTRFKEGIKAGMRIHEGQEIYEIKMPPIDPDGSRKWLEIHTRQVLQNGS